MDAAPSATAGPLPSPLPTISPLPTATPWGQWISSQENLALDKHVRVSHQAWGSSGHAAIDGNPRTAWNSGAGPTQWIEVDLGAPYDIQEIHLVPAQDRPGVTVHRVLGRGTGASSFITLCTFESQTSDSSLLACTAPTPWRDIQFIRVETSFSPAPIGWREIEVIQAAEEAQAR